MLLLKRQKNKTQWAAMSQSTHQSFDEIFSRYSRQDVLDAIYGTDDDNADDGNVEYYDVAEE
jgi:phosphoglycolate phosphatase-like HAD superfamily hydrolase